jgi:hypothetical protein
MAAKLSSKGFNDLPVMAFKAFHAADQGNFSSSELKRAQASAL